MEKKSSITSWFNFLGLARSNSSVQQQLIALVRTFDFRPIKVIFISCLISVFLWVFTPPAVALTQIRLFDISYNDCPPELAQGAVISSGSAAANCFIVKGKAENATYKTVYDADIFGRIYDANNDPVLQNRTRLGSIAEIPPGISDFELRISVPASQPTPLKLKQFKAAGFSGQVRKS
ncbi:MAG: biotin carboxylase [Aulosira sp. ZfuVER01]|nr:biotin carboxylase [Aulosira sp. ZfuVER01]MDZ8000854.1 biotin carboxylase [Aulosira sp. DedVER01a]MDZ8055875.1 biotin carboxylase [Aulosira sp. ZfuCHP01]